VDVPTTLASVAVDVHAVIVAVVWWLALIGVAGAVLVAAGAHAWWQRRQAAIAAMPPVTPLRARSAGRQELARLVAEVDALSIQAISAGIAAADAEEAITAARVRCRVAEWTRERAWYEYDTAHHEYLSALRATSAGDEVWPTANANGAWPVVVAAAATAVSAASGVSAVVAAPHSGALAPVPHDRPDLRDEVARAAVAAYRRGGISLEQLRGILRHSSGWTHLHARHERDVLLRRAAEREARRSYHAATEAERHAHLAVDVAVVAARAWADEAGEAADEARRARVFATECLRRAATRRRLRRRGSPTRQRGG
jgi:hypothetical protein